MATLSVLKLNDPNGADRVLLAFQGMQERQMVTVEDAAVVSWPAGQEEAPDPPSFTNCRLRALGGAFWGFLFGLIFFVPLLGGRSAQAAGGALMGSVAIPRHRARLHQAGAREKCTPREPRPCLC